MRQIINVLASLYPYLKHGAWTIMLFFVFSLCSCFKLYYQTNSVQKTDSESLDKFRLQNKHFIVHSAGSFFELKNLRLTGETISGARDSLNPKYDNLLNPVGEKAIPLSRKEKDRCFDEVHLYTNSAVSKKDSVSLLISEIKRVDAYGPDRKAIKDSRLASIIAITIGTTAVIGLGFYAASQMVIF
jgi:hypothetical protein